MYLKIPEEAALSCADLKAEDESLTSDGCGMLRESFAKKILEKHILPIASLCRKLLQVAILTYPMLLAQLLPELTSDYNIFPY